MPEGLYLRLMDALKIDFDSDSKNITTKAIVINKSIPQYIQMTKVAMIQSIIVFTKNEDSDVREELLLKITSGRIFINDIKDLCTLYRLPTTCLNPRWVRQEEMILQNPHIVDNTILLRGISPTVLTNF